MVRNGRMDRRTVERKKRHIEVGDPPKNGGSAHVGTSV